jgi:hypothetical protein
MNTEKVSWYIIGTFKNKNTNCTDMLLNIPYGGGAAVTECVRNTE